MGQKVNPIGFRLAVTKDWRSKWYATGKDYATKLHEDIKIRKFVKDFCANLNKDLKGSTAAISRIAIERAWNNVRVTISTARPGLIIGPKGENITKMTEALTKLCKGAQIKLDIMEIRQPELDAQLVAENIATQLERRVSFRRAMKRAVQVAMDFGAEGIRVRCAGRLGGADIARAEQYREGKVPLQTLRAPIDYGFAEAHTLYGLIGIKCWINKRPEVAGAPSNNRPNRAPRPRRDRSESQHREG
ncbi:MAG: 30S ribosomal protein S3 [Akkermansia sp.]|nr:30S ribosomal protein S3 [Akkermansia sp.]